MNPDQPHTPPDAPLPHDALSSDEARVLAVLLGEASPFEREAVEELLSRRPDLRAYRDRTAALLEQLPAAARPDSAPELRLDPDRRAALLAKLRRPAAAAEAKAPLPFPRRSNVVVFFRTALSSAPKYAAILAVLLILAAMLIPGVGKKVRYAERPAREMDPEEFAAAASGIGDADCADMSVTPSPVAGAEVSAKSFSRKAPVGSIGGRPRIASKSERADIALPAAPAPASANFADGLSSGGPAVASGGGEGRGIGIGKGSDMNFVGAIGQSVEADAVVSKQKLLEGVDCAWALPEGFNAPAESKEIAADDSRALTAGNRTLDSEFRAKRETKDADKAPSAGNVSVVGRTSSVGSKSHVEAELRSAETEYERALARRDATMARQSGWSFDPARYEMELAKREADEKAEDRAAQKAMDLAHAKWQAALAKKREETIKGLPQYETLTADNAWSTFSLNVSDVSFRLAGEAVKRGGFPDPSGIRTEEFVNAQRFRDPAPLAHEAVSLRQEQARHPFAHNRTLLRLSLRTAAEGRAAGSPLHLVVLLDASGSMERADRRDTVAAALNALADNLRAGDKVSVIGFSRSTRLLIDRMDGSNASPLRELAKSGVPSEGGTNLENALATAYAELARRAPSGAGARVLLLTDGAANLGDADPARLAAVVEANRRQGRALDCFGIGFDGYNDVMLENLSRKGDGRYAYLNNADEARSELGAKLAGALRPFANDVKVQVEFNPARVASWRLLGYEKHRLRKQDFRDNTVDAAELAAAESGTAVYSLEIKPDGAGDLGMVRVRYRVPGTQDYREREWGVPNTGAPAFADAPEGVRLAACAAFVAECYADNPNAAGTDRAELRKQVARLAASRPGDAPLTTLRLLADRLAATPAK